MSDPRELETAAQTRRAPAPAPTPTTPAKPTRGDAVRGQQRRTEGLADQERLTSVLGPGPRPNPIFPTGTADLVAAQIQRAVREDSDLSAGSAALLRATQLATAAYDDAGAWSAKAHHRILDYGHLEGLGHGLWERRSAALEYDLTAYALLSAHGRAQQTLTASSLSMLALAQRDHHGLELGFTHAGLRHAGPPEASIDTTTAVAERRSFEGGAEALYRTDHHAGAPDKDQHLVEAFETLAASGQWATAVTLKARQMALAARRREASAEAEAAKEPKTLIAKVEAVLAGALSFAQSAVGFASAKTLASTASLYQALGGAAALWPTRTARLEQEIRALDTLIIEAGAESERQTILAAMTKFGNDFKHFSDALRTADKARDADQKRLGTVGKALDAENRKAGTLAPDREHMVAVGQRVARVDAAASSNAQARRALVYAQASSIPRSVDLVAKTTPRSGEVDIDGQRERIAKSNIFAATASIFGGVVAELDARAATLDRLAPDRG